MPALHRAGAVLGTAFVFVASAVGGALLHVDTPRARHLVAEELNAALTDAFRGRLHVDAIGALGLGGVAGVDATLDDPWGVRVLTARGLRARVSAWTALRSLLARHVPLHIVLTEVRADSVDGDLDAAPDGSVRVAAAFEPRHPSPATPAAPEGPGLWLEIRSLGIAHVTARGTPAGAPTLDVDVDGLAAGLEMTNDRLEIDLARGAVAARRIAQGADVRGLLRGHLVLPSAAGSKPTVHAQWEGTAGAVAETARAALDGDRVEAVVDVPPTPPDALRTLWPAAPFDVPAAVHAEAHGTLAAVDLDVRATLGAASASVRGRAALAEPRSAKLSVTARDVDVRELAAAAPRSRLGLDGDIAASQAADGAIAASVDLRFGGGALGETPLPPATVRAKGQRSAAGALEADAEVTVEEPGAPTHVTAHLDRRRVVRFGADADVAELGRVRALGGAVRGRATLVARGVVDLDDRTLDASAHVDTLGLATGGVTAGAATVDATASGPLVDPLLSVRAAARSIAAGGLRLTTVTASADGHVSDARVAVLARGPDTPDVDAEAVIGLRGGLSVQHATVALARRGERAVVTSDAVALVDGGVRVDGARIEGLGEPTTADASYAAGTLRLKARSGGLDLGRAARLAQLEQRLQGGTLAFDVDMTATRHGAHGNAEFHLSRATLAGVPELGADVTLGLDGKRASLQLHAAAGNVGRIDLSAPEVQIAGAALEPGSWRRAWGKVQIDASADLDKLAALVPADLLPVGQASGHVVVQGHVEREGLSDTTPDIALHLKTQGLVLAPKTVRRKLADGSVAAASPPWLLAGVDFDLDATLDGSSGALALQGTALDGRGALVAVDVKSPHALCRDLFVQGGSCFGAVEMTPFTAHVSVPARDLATLPALLRQTYVGGKLRADLAVNGTLEAPKVDLSVALDDGRGSLLRRTMNLALQGRYDGARATASLTATAHEKRLLDAEAQLDASAAALLASPRAAPWVASARAHLDGFPLQSIPALDDRLVTGLVTGDVSLDDLHKDARAKADLSIASLQLGSVSCRGAKVSVSADGKAIDAEARLDQSDGYATTAAHASVTWGAALAPALDPEHPLRASLTSKAFRLVALQPFVAGVLDELDGTVDASAQVELDPKTRGAKLSGNLDLKGGLVEAVAGGGELHGISGHVAFTPDGVVTLQRLSGYGVTGRFDAAGSARLAGTRLESAKLILVIPRREALPVSADGVAVGNVQGRIEATASSRADGSLAIDLAVPAAGVALPQTSSTHAQPLGPLDKVVTGAHRGGPEQFVLLPLDPVDDDAPKTAASGGGMKLGVDLGRVEITKGGDLKIDLGGKLAIESAGKTRVTGQIHLARGGLLVIQGKRFTVENGTVTFVGDDPGNPEVVVTAAYAAPDGTTVYADFVGPLKTGKVTLRSEPALSQQEIVQLLLFGSPDGQQGPSQSSSTENSAIATAGGEAAAPLNHALNQLGLGAVTARVDTSQTNPRPEVEVQIAKDLSVQIAVVLGIPPPGVNPDRTLLTLDWRFLAKWSLESTVGDAGTTIFDVLWRKRY